MSTIGILSPKMLPLKLYQISNKWRDEIKPRFGFLRSREFMMKDLYTFDINLNNAQETYALVCNAYENIFKKIGITYIKSNKLNNISYLLTLFIYIEIYYDIIYRYW